MIKLLIGTLLTGSFFISFISEHRLFLIRVAGTSTSFFTFFLSLFLWVLFDDSTPKMQFVNEFVWLSQSNINFTVGVDGISLFFLLLSTLLIPLCLLASWSSVTVYVKEYFIAFLLMEAFLVLVFSVSDLLLFYIFFESILIPMYVVIGVWGSRERKIRAAYMFFLYTLLGSVLMLLGVLYIYVQVGSTDYGTLLNYEFSVLEQKLLWLSFFTSFAAKVPMFPAHIWLPEAHVEAPTAGSVILAGILLKLGTYGFLRFSLPLFPLASFFFSPLIYTLSIMGVVYASLTAIRQTDLKRIVAYTSVAHMNLVVLGLFSFNIIGLEGAIIQSISHGFISSALFLIVGVLYDRHHTRMLKYYSGLVHTMPFFSALFLLFTMANIALPGTSSFVGEFLILIGVFKVSTAGAFLSATGMVFGGAYSLLLFNRIVYGNLKLQYISYFSDINKREFFVFLPLVIGTLFLGVYSEIFLTSLHSSVFNLVEAVNPSYLSSGKNCCSKEKVCVLQKK
jgi:proton-translocating NADH-quinone oxidoreductase chain M